MKFVSFTSEKFSAPTLGVWHPNHVQPLDMNLEALAEAVGTQSELRRASTPIPHQEITLQTPTQPSKIICVGLNYKHHALEMNKPIPEEPLIFLKPPTVLIAHTQNIVLPPESSNVHFEGEMALVIGKRARRVSPQQALDCVLGVSCFLDITARDIQRREKRYTRGKGFDTFGPYGPILWTHVDPDNIAIATRVNGQQRQSSSTSDMIFSVAHIVSFISHIMTLEPGDIIPTGTPSGVGPLHPGDRVEVELDGVGVLTSPVVALDT